MRNARSFIAAMILLILSLSYAYGAPNISIVLPTNITYTTHPVNLTYDLSGATNCYVELDAVNISYPVCANTTLTYVHYNDSRKVLALDFADGTGSVAYDRSGYRNNATLVSASWNLSDRYSSALRLDGTSSHATITSDLSRQIGNDITVAAWAYSNVTTGQFRAILEERYAGDGNIQFYVGLGTDTGGTTDKLCAAFFNGGWRQVCDGTAFSANQWHFVAASYNGSLIRLYRDGQNVANTTYAASLPVGTNGWYVGRRHDTANGDHKWSGYIDELVLWNRTLDEREIRELYLDQRYDGYHALTVYANDSGGSINSSAVAFGVNLAPRVYLHLPYNYTYGIPEIPLNFTIEDSDLYNCWYTNSTGDNVTVAGCTNTTIGGIEGYQTITLYANDTAGQIASANASYSLNLTQPHVTLNVTTVLPLSTIGINITAAGEDTCTIYVHRPDGYVDAFNGSVNGTACVSTYIPSFLNGTYYVNASTKRQWSDTGNFTVTPAWTSLSIQSFSANATAYFPGDKITHYWQLIDDLGGNQTGFRNKSMDADYDPPGTVASLDIRREIVSIGTDGSAVARIIVEYDSSGSWGEFYPGTQVNISVYGKDGISPVPDDITVTNHTQNAGTYLAQSFTNDSGVYTQVSNITTTFNAAERLAYMEVTVPPNRSLSDVVFRINSIRQVYQASFEDRIYIAETYMVDGQFPGGDDGDITYTTGDTFTGLGRFPIYLPLLPTNNGGFMRSFLDPHNESLTMGVTGNATGGYQNTLTWADYIKRNYSAYLYADRWGYGHDIGGPLNLSFDEARANALQLGTITRNLTYYAPGASILFSTPVNNTVAPLGGLNSTDRNNDATGNSQALEIRRQILNVSPDGSVTARLIVEFDTSSSWSEFYAGTQVNISVYGRDGIAGVPSDITVANGTTNAGALLSQTLSNSSGIYRWSSGVTGTFNSADRSTHLDFVIPAGRSLSDIVFSIDSIVMVYAAQFGETIYIGNVSVADAQLNDEDGDGNGNDGYVVYGAGDPFLGLGAFPVYLPLTPADGAVFLRAVSASYGEPTNGTVTASGGNYSIRHTWASDAAEQFTVSMCANKWGYSDDGIVCTGTVTLNRPTPVIVSVNDSTALAQPANNATNVTFSVDWTLVEEPSEPARFYVCNSTMVTYAGCLEKTFCSSAYSASKSQACNYTVEDTLPTMNSYWAIVCTDSASCSLLDGPRTFYVNASGNPPVIDLNYTFPIPYFGATVAVVADVLDYDEDLVSVNFTVIAPNGTVVLASHNGTRDGDLWSSSEFTTDLAGRWNYTIFALDAGGRNDTVNGQIRFLNITQTLSSSLADRNQTVVLAGSVTYSNGSPTAGTPIYIYLDGIIQSYPDDWWNRSYPYRVPVQFNESVGIARNETYVRVNITIPSGHLTHENATALICGGVRHPMETYALTTNGSSVLELQAVAMFNISSMENKSCHVYYGTASPDELLPSGQTGWSYVGDTSRTGDVYDIPLGEQDCTGQDADGEHTSVCGDADSTELNQWCYFRANATGNQSFWLQSDDEARLQVEGTTLISTTCCSGVTSSTSMVSGRYYLLEIDWSENSGGQNVYNAHAASNTNNIDTECYPAYGDEWALSVAVGAEEGVMTTDADGNYSRNLAAPGDAGVYEVLVNASAAGEYGLTSQSLTVQQFPHINSNTTNQTAYFNASIKLIANVTDNNLVSVNFTLIAPNGSVVIDGVNGTNDGDLWSSSAFMLDSAGRWNYSIIALDGSGNNASSSGQIRFLDLSMFLTPSSLDLGESFAVSGNINSSDGTPVEGEVIVVHMNGSRLSGVGWALPGWQYLRPVIVEEQSGSNLTDYQVGLTLDTSSLVAAGKMRDDCADIRVVRQGAIVPHWTRTGCNTTSTQVWIKTNLSAGENATFQLYYGNADATDTSNGSSVMLVYEDMAAAPSGTLAGVAVYNDTEHFVMLTPAEETLINGELHYLRNPGAQGYFTDYQAYIGTGNGNHAWFQAYGQSLATHDDTGTGYIISFDDGGDTIRVYYNTTQLTSVAKTGMRNGLWVNISIRHYGNTTEVYYNNSLVINYTDGTSRSKTGQYLSWGAFAGHGYAVNDHFVRGLVVGKLSEHPPLVSYGTEEPGVFSDAQGAYAWSFPAPTAPGSYPVMVNATHNGEYGQATRVLTVKQYPRINSNMTNQTAYFNATVTIVANVTDDNLASVNFTVIAPNGTMILSGVNGAQDGDLWSSPAFTLTSVGRWNYTIVAYDADGNNDSTSGQIRFLDISETLDPQLVNADAQTTVHGRVNSSNGSAVANGRVQIYVNGTLQPPNWWDVNWPYRKNLTINASQVNGTLTDFPMLVRLAGDNDLSAKALASGNDVAFVNASGEKLDHEIEHYNNATGELIAWVRIPVLSNVSDTVIYLYYGNPEAASQQNSTGVWSTSLKGVWHMANGTTLSGKDSTSYGNNGTISSVTAVEGQIDGAGNFSSAYIQVPENDTLDPASITLTAWARISSSPTNYGNIVSKGGNSGYRFRIDNARTVTFLDRGGTNDMTTTKTVALGNWTYIVVSGNASGLRIYLDGILNASNAVAYGGPNTGNAFDIGVGSGEYFNGLIDEVRIWNVSQSLEWVQAEYNSQKPNATFFAVGSEETTTRTDQSGQYSLTFAVPSVPGTYPVLVNASYDGEYGQAIQNLVVTQYPSINSNMTNQTAYFNATVTIVANVTDDNLASVNFTVIAPNGTMVLDNANGTQAGDNWASGAFTLSAPGRWNYTIVALDADGNNATTTGQIRFLDISVEIDTTGAASGYVIISGALNDSAGSPLASQTVELSFDGVVQTRLSDGSDGALNAVTANTIINNYTHAMENLSAGNTTITVNSSAGFGNDDTILVIQMQNGTGGVAGAYEFATIEDVSADTITLKHPLSASYYSLPANTIGASVTQIVRVPEYTNVTVQSGASLVPKAWDGYSGGILILRSQGAVTVAGALNATGRGYRGGQPPTTTYTGGQPGESINGSGVRETGSTDDIAGSYLQNAGGGGGGDSTTNAGDNVGGGGGGGAFATEGTKCSYTGYNSQCGMNGTAYGNATTPLFGAGGGAGGTEDGAGQTAAGAGGTGGGIIWISADSINISGIVVANGSAGVNGVAEDGGGGGGAGGFIYLLANDLALGTDLLHVGAGAGGAASYGTNSGGAGGKGRILLERLSASGSVSSGLYGSMANLTGSPGPVTNASGAYWYNFSHAGLIGSHTYLAVATADGEYGEASRTLDAQLAPVISSHATNGSAYVGASVRLVANVTDDNLASVNFTVIAPNGTVMLASHSGTQAGDLWTSSAFTLTSIGRWNYTIVALDADGNNATSSGQIRFLDISETLTPATVSLGSAVVVSGRINASDGSAASNAPLAVYVDGEAYPVRGNVVGEAGSWRYERIVDVTGPASGLADYQVNITLDTASLIASGKMQQSCADVRVVDGSLVPLPHWVQRCDNATTVVWVRTNFSANENKTLSLLYGNPGSNATANISATFLFGDDFGGASLRPGWTEVTAGGASTGTLSDGYWTKTCNGQCDWWTGTDINAGLYAAFPQPEGSDITWEAVVGLQNQSGPAESLAGIMLYQSARDGWHWAYYRNANYFSLQFTGSAELCSVQPPYSPAYFKIRKTTAAGVASSNNFTFWVSPDMANWTRCGSYTGQDIMSNVGLVIKDWGTGATQGTFDSFFIKRYAESEPVVNVSEERPTSLYTNDSGEYALQITAPLTPGAHEVLVNATHSGEYGQVAGVLSVDAGVTVTIFSPLSTTYNTASLDLDFTVDTPNGIDSCWYTNSTGATVALPGCANTTIVAIEGGQSITVFANGTNGDTGNATVAFNVDLPPRINLSSPLNTTYAVPTVNFTYAVSDANGPNSCKVELDGINMSFPLCSNTTLTYVHYNASDPSRVLALDFAEGAGTFAYDRSGLGNHLDRSSAVWNASGKYGTALSFDGNDVASVQHSASLNISQPYITIMAWVRSSVASQAAWATIVNKRYGAGAPYNNWIMDTGSAGNAYDFCVTNAAGAGPIYGQWCVNSGAGTLRQEWVHVTGVYNSTHVLLYINGALNSSLAATIGDIATSTHPVRIGSPAGTGEFFQGSVDEVVIWNRSLSSTEISDIYHERAFAGGHTLQVYANDTGGNWGRVAAEFTVLSDSCTPTAGQTWTLDLADNCVISGLNVAVTNWTITSSGSGNVTLRDSNISYSHRTISSIVGDGRLIYGDNLVLRGG